MTILQIKLLIMHLPDDMEMFIDDGNSFTPVCGESGEVMSVSIGNTIEPMDIFVIEPCACETPIPDKSFNLNITICQL